MAKRKPVEPEGFDFLLVDHEGTDPRPCIQLPEVSSECGRYSDDDVDSAAIVYDFEEGEDEEGTEVQGGHLAVLVIVARGSSPADAARTIVQAAAHVAGELLGKVADHG